MALLDIAIPAERLNSHCNGRNKAMDVWLKTTETTETPSAWSLAETNHVTPAVTVINATRSQWLHAGLKIREIKYIVSCTE
jgi:hypothetical protein